jgi:Ca2+-binding EF-hand superfamily protein
MILLVTNVCVCAVDKASLVLFAFDLYDKDHSGQLEIAEIKKMLTEVRPPPLKGV